MYGMGNVSSTLLHIDSRGGDMELVMVTVNMKEGTNILGFLELVFTIEFLKKHFLKAFDFKSWKYKLLGGSDM
jgi:hypothetical protein